MKKMFKLGDFVKYDVDESYGTGYVIGNMKLDYSEDKIPVIANTNFIGMPINPIFLKLVESGLFDVASPLRNRYITNFGEIDE
jgi:hypothetical protein